MRRTPWDAALFLALAALLAAPWIACRIAGWDASVEVITAGGPLDARVTEAVAAVVARLVAVLVAPIPAIAASLSVGVPLVARWTARPPARTLPT